MDIARHISVDPNVCHGQPCFRGTRIMVYQVLEMLESGETAEQILRSYPALTVDAIRAALHYAAELIKRDEYTPFPAAA